MEREFSAVVTRGPVAFVAFCPELGVSSQGATEKSALRNLKEALELYLEDEDVQEMLKKNPAKKGKDLLYRCKRLTDSNEASNNFGKAINQIFKQRGL